MVSFTWFTIAWTCSSSRFKAVCFISSCEVLLVLEVSPVLSLPDFDPSLTTYIRDSMAWMQRSIEPLETLLPTTGLPGLKQLSQFLDFQMNRQCNTDFQGALMDYFD
jgi:hypothetical protein